MSNDNGRREGGKDRPAGERRGFGGERGREGGAKRSQDRNGRTVDRNNGGERRSDNRGSRAFDRNSRRDDRSYGRNDRDADRDRRSHDRDDRATRDRDSGGERRSFNREDRPSFDRDGRRERRAEGGERRFSEKDRRPQNRDGRASGRGVRRDGAGREPKGPSARDVALKALQDVVRGEAYAAQALDRRLGEARLSDEDRRLAASIFYFAVENRLYIESALSPFLQEKPEPVVVDILHIAAAQLLFMDKIPDHAAVDEAVKQVRACRREGFTGLANGVLRNLIRARNAGEVKLPDREADPEAWLSARYSIAPELVSALVAAYGFDEAERFAAWQPERHSQTIRPNRARMDGPAFEAWLDGKGMKWQRGAVEDAYVVEDGGSLAADEGYRKGEFSIQGQSAMLAAQAVEAKPGMQILDACAAPGGKTCLMAEKMNGSGRVYAWDVHPHRVELIRAAARRLGLDNVRPSEHDARRPMESINMMMDAVLVDAPCSGLGVIAEKPDIKYRQNAQSLAALPKVQADILDACAGAVKVGGLLVYATCTVLPVENGDQVRAFLERHPNFGIDTDDRWLPEALKPRLEGGMLQLLPQRDGMEGFFIARLRRKGV